MEVPSPEGRRLNPRIAFLLLHATRDRLRDRFTSGEDRRAAG